MRTSLATLAAAIVWAQPARAAPARGLVVTPRPISRTGLSYFKLNARPGSSVRAGTIELRNPTSRRLRVALSAVDGETLSTLGSGYAPPGSQEHGSTLWLRLGRPQVALPPHSRVSVPVAVLVPSQVAQFCPKTKCGSEAEGYVTGGHKLAAKSLKLNSTGAKFGGGTGNAPTLQCATACNIDSATAVKIASAATGGAGESTWTTTGFSATSLELSVPSTVRALPSEEVYRINLLWTLSSGP